MEENVFSWQFGTCNFIYVYKDNITCAHLSYNGRRKIKVECSTMHLSKDDWEQVLICVKEAKDVLKKVKRV